MYKMKQITDFKDYYITENGTVISTKHGKTTELTPVLCKGTGYFLVTLVKEGNVRKNKRIHRLLAEAYIPNPENKPQVNHIDGVKTNNQLSNLEWSTSQENSQHAVDMGLTSYDTTKVIVEQYLPDETTFVAEHESLHQAGRTTGIAWQNISKVVRGIRRKAGGFHWKYKNV